MGSKSKRRLRAAKWSREPPQSDPSSERQCSYPGWVMLDRFGHRKDSSFPAVDGTTTAYASTSSGHQIRVSFRLAPPPGTSRLLLDWSHGPKKNQPSYCGITEVMAAHRNRVLFELTGPLKKNHDIPFDYFVYTADAASNLSRPSLSLLPPCYVTTDEEGPHLKIKMMSEATGLLCLGEDDEFVVAQLEPTGENMDTAKIYMFHSHGSGEWEVKKLPIRHDPRKDRRDLFWWVSDVVIPFADRFLCWVDYYRGIFFLDIAGDDLFYVPLPVTPPAGNPDHPEYGRGCPEECRSLCVTDGGRAMKFVNVDNHRCCCASACITCPGIRLAFTITTWTLGSDLMAWGKDGTLGADELEGLALKPLPRVQLEFPIVSMDDPHVICFVLTEGDNTTRLVAIDMRNKALVSFDRYVNDDKEDISLEDGSLSFHGLTIPSDFSKYLDKQHDKRFADSIEAFQELIIC